MTDTNRDRDGEMIDTAWRTFAADDEAVVPPAELERKTIAAWRASLRHRRPARRRALLWVGAAAALLLVVAIDRRREAPDRAEQSGGSPTLTSPREERTSTLPPALITLAADPIRDTEALRIVRVRLPRSALRAAGLMIDGPDGAVMVDVDLLIGEDGLPRDVRRVHSIQE